MSDFARRFVKTDYWREGSDFDRFMGSSDWVRLKVDVPLPQLRSELLSVYRAQLATIGYEVDDSVGVANTRERILYHLIYASRDARGLDFWRKIAATDASQRRRLF
jgi:hypothetical protein